MYSWIWRHLPGPVALRAAITAVLVIAAISLLLFVVFPWLDPLLPFNHVTAR